MGIIVHPPANTDTLFAQIHKKVIAAWHDTADDIAELIVQRGRADISSGGNFGTRWTDGFKAAVEKTKTGASVTVTMAVPYWRVFQTGATINGKPLLWIPLSFGTSVGKLARERGNLFRVPNRRAPNARAGKSPLLLDRDTKRPEYFGVKSVTLKKRFHLLEICHQIAGNELATIFSKHFNSNAT